MLYKWKLEDIFETDDSWKAAKDDLEGKVDGILKYKGKLSEDSSIMLECFEYDSSFSNQLSKLYAYASMRSDEDTGNSKYNGMLQQLQFISTKYGSNASFIDPEICLMTAETVSSFISEQPGLEVYEMYLNELQRRKTHKLSEKEEALLAESGLMASTSSSIYKIFANSELPFPTVVVDGQKARLTHSGYALHRTNHDRNVREKVFKSFWGMFDSFKQTFGAQLSGNVKKELFYARARNYDTVLESALDRYNIPVEVYHSLIDNVNKNLDVLHRYIGIKKKLIGVDSLKYSDIYILGTEELKSNYSFEYGAKLTLQALEPLGKEYLDAANRCIEDRWVDVYPSKGKRSGGYCNGSAYDVHPYILLNYNGKFEDVSVLAHEMGHAMHSYFSNKTQPYPIAGYSIFVAEVASITNEILLVNKMLKEAKTDDEKLYYLLIYAEKIRSTLYRQTHLAEFELRMYELAEREQPLTGDVLTKLYGDLMKKYCGHDKGVSCIEDLYTVEWAFIPHFYTRYYVYQYATSFTASVAIAEKILNNEPQAVEKFNEFLSTGGSDYPIEILKNAGVDLTGPEAFDYTVNSFKRTLDQIEDLLAK